jgi:hypothetical protein
MSRHHIALAVVLFAAAVIALPGCQRVNIEKTVTLDIGDIKEPAQVSAPSGQQKIRVEINATEPIDVDVALEEQAVEARKSLTAGKRPDAGKVLASKQGVKTETLEATIPAGKDYTVILSGARKKSEVKLKLNSI